MSKDIPWINPHCSLCGWVFPVTEKHCPRCQFPRWVDEGDDNSRWLDDEPEDIICRDDERENPHK